eukprot:jgi/Undpi1/2042/HiC_scaffold_12.g05428.m1
MGEDGSSNDEESSGGSDSENDDEDGWAYIIDTYAVIDPAEDTVTSSLQRPSALRKLGDALDVNAVAAAETVHRMGKHVPGGKHNVLVVPHGSILSDFHNDDAWVAGFVHLFPEGCADPNIFQAKGLFRLNDGQGFRLTNATTSRARTVASFSAWPQSLSDTKRCLTCSLNFAVGCHIRRRGDSIENIEGFLVAFAAELQLGKQLSIVLNAHLGVVLPLRKSQVVSHIAS